MKLLRILMMSFLSAGTIASAQERNEFEKVADISAIQADKTIHLMEGHPAPFTGKLIPQYQWFEANVRLEAGDRCEAELRDCYLSPPPPPDDFSLKGLFYGALIGFSVAHLLK